MHFCVFCFCMGREREGRIIRDGIFGGGEVVLSRLPLPLPLPLTPNDKGGFLRGFIVFWAADDEIWRPGSHGQRQTKPKPVAGSRWIRLRSPCVFFKEEYRSGRFHSCCKVLYFAKLDETAPAQFPIPISHFPFPTTLLFTYCLPGETCADFGLLSSLSL